MHIAISALLARSQEYGSVSLSQYKETILRMVAEN